MSAGRPASVTSTPSAMHESVARSCPARHRFCLLNARC
jgi:hypothetical protein